MDEKINGWIWFNKSYKVYISKLVIGCTEGAYGCVMTGDLFVYHNLAAYRENCWICCITEVATSKNCLLKIRAHEYKGQHEFTTGWSCMLSIQHGCLTEFSGWGSFICNSFLRFSDISVSVHQAKTTAELKLEVRYKSVIFYMTSPGQQWYVKHISLLIRKQIRP